MYFTISETPRMQSLSVGLKWTQVLRAHQPRHPRQRYVAAANRRYVDTDTFGSQSVHTCAATRTPHAWIDSPSIVAYSCSLSCAMATHAISMAPNRWRRWRPEDCGNQSEHIGGAGQRGGAGMGMQAGGHTSSLPVALAVQEGPPSPAARPSTGWAGPRAIEHTLSRVRRAQGAMPTMKVHARPSRAR